jgi:DNA-binding LytR/AlgR family response regulator
MLIYNISDIILHIVCFIYDAWLYDILYIYISHMYIQVVTKKKQRSKTPDQSPSLDPPRTGFVKKPRRWIVNG